MRKTTTALAIALVAAVVPSAAQQLGTPGRIDTGFDVIMKQGGIMDMHTMKELDQKRQSQVQTRSEATVSKLDLKAPGKARNEYNKGMQFLSRNDLQSAVTSFNKALAIYPEFVAAHNALGCTYFKLKQNDLAREHFARAIELDDHVSSSYLNLGRTELALGDRTQAQAAFEKASSLSPLDANLLVVLAYVQFLNHDYAATIQTAQRAHGRPHPGTATVHYFSAASWPRKQRKVPWTQR